MIAAALAVLLPISALSPSTARAEVPAADATDLWPTFATPTTVLVADAHGLSNTDMVTLTTLQGVYNAGHRDTRLYLNWRPDDDVWETRIPKPVKVRQLPAPGDQGLVSALLKRFRSAISGAIVTDPQNADTVNLATTMAGIKHAVVITPGQQQLVADLGIPVIFSFDTPEFTADDPVATYQWGIDHLLADTSTRILTMLPGGHGGDRDYAVATRSFVFSLTSTKPDQKALFGTILGHTPANTPVMGWVPNENPDVAYLSSLGHFINASDNLSNGSVWASMPAAGRLHQPSEPAPIAVRPNTVYIAFVESEGDNVQYMEHRMSELWSGGDLDSLPLGWTIAPGTTEFAPTLARYFYANLPRNSELLAGPSGIGYATQMGGTDLTEFARLSAQIMRRNDLKTVDNFEALGYLDQYAQDSGVLQVSTRDPLLPTKIKDTLAVGQSSGYIKTPQALFCTIHQQSASIEPGKPLFMEPMVDSWTMTPTDVLHIAQQLARSAQQSGLHYVFTTPSELARTMKAYDAGQQGLPAGNVQSMTGEQALQKPIIDPPYPTGTVTVTGPNLITNPSGAAGTDGWTTSGGSLEATTYAGQPALHWTSTSTTGQTWVRYYPAVQNGQTYTFSADVAGSGQVFLDTYAGGDLTTLPVQLTGDFQHLTWTATVPTDAPGGGSGGAPQLQVRESGAGPVSVYIRNASVAASTPAC